MWYIKSTEIIESELKAIEIIAEMSCINAGEKVEITDFNGKIYNLIKPNIQSNKKEKK
jgi:hypothetical protein